jgi:hypothetical protein
MSLQGAALGAPLRDDFILFGELECGVLGGSGIFRAAA